MFIDDEGNSEARVSTRTALRHVLVFQLKLTADALRDFLLSPLSLLAFAIDALRKPPLNESVYLRLMLLGRRSDRMINLFDDHGDGEGYTIDSAVDHLEARLRPQDRPQAEMSKEWACKDSGETVERASESKRSVDNS